MHRPQNTIEEAVAILRAKPGIDICRLPPGSRIIVETAQYLYEMVVENPEASLLEIGGSDPRFRGRPVGALLRSVFDVDGKIFVPHWIGKDLRMQIILSDRTSFSLAKTLSASVEGDNWHYDVF